MNKLHFKCPFCERQVAIRKSMAGRVFTHSECGAEIRAPDGAERTDAELVSEPGSAKKIRHVDALLPMKGHKGNRARNVRVRSAKRARRKVTGARARASANDLARHCSEPSAATDENIDLDQADLPIPLARAGSTRANLLPKFKTRDEEGDAVHGYFWSEDQLGLQSQNTPPPRWLYLTACSAVILLVAADVRLAGLANPTFVPHVGEFSDASSEHIEKNKADSAQDAAVPEPRFDAAWDEAHREQREEAKSAIWQLLLAPDFRSRLPFVLEREDEDTLKEYDQLYAPLESDSLSIMPLFGWQESDGNRFAFLVKTDQNPDGFVAEVHSTGNRHCVHWERFVQHHHQTFLQFVSEKPDTPQRFYVTVRRVHSGAGDSDSKASSLDHYEVSGTNPNQWFAAVIDSRTTTAEKLRGVVAWDRVMLVLEFSWNKIGDGAQALFMRELLAEAWD